MILVFFFFEIHHNLYAYYKIFELEDSEGIVFMRIIRLVHEPSQIVSVKQSLHEAPKFKMGTIFLCEEWWLGGTIYMKYIYVLLYRINIMKADCICVKIKFQST